MNKLDIAKKVAHFTVFTGSGKIISDIIRNNTNPETMRDTITYTAGGYAMAGLVAAEAAKYIDDQIDEWAATYRQIVHGEKKPDKNVVPGVVIDKTDDTSS